MHIAHRFEDTSMELMPGLYAAGEVVGGLSCFNNPGGTELMVGAVFGRLAGTSTGKAAIANC
ncbi:MAG: tricarballylate dehydrogenase [Gammaproteobacteria bacterium]|jgi:tricarballylate dehydrogenase